jgi:hypothetical protein
VIVGTGGAPQDYPTLQNGGLNGTQYTQDPNLTIPAYASGANANARIGCAIVTVEPDGSVKTEMKFLDDPLSPLSSVSTLDRALVRSRHGEGDR